jgi:hypothetical protein
MVAMRSLELSGASWALEASIRELREASACPKKNKSVDKLKLTDFDIDTTLAATIIQVLRKHNNHKNNEDGDCDDHCGVTELSLEECSGHVDIVVTAALTSSSSLSGMESLSLSIGRLATAAFTPCAHALGVGLQLNTSLQKLVIQSGSNVFFTLSSEAATSLEQGLIGNSTLRTLHIQSCRFVESNSVRSLARGLRGHRFLKHVTLRSCFVANGRALEDVYMAELIRALEHNTDLISLDISGNKCLHHGIAALSSLLDRTRLKTLDLSCQCIMDQQEDEFMNLSLLVAALGRTSTLESIELRFNKLNDQDMAYLAAALTHNTSIQYVGLASNKITNTGISILASRIPLMKGLKELVLTNINAFDQKGMLELARALELNWTVQRVECDPTIPSYKTIRYYADLNWGGRRFLLGNNYHTPVPPAVWPLVLARVNGMQERENGKERQANILYCLLRQGPALFPM